MKIETRDIPQKVSDCQRKRILNLCKVLSIAIAGIILLYFLSPPTSASLLVPQGSRIYMNETLDLSQAASWPDYTLAWCGGYYNCDNPKIILDISKGNMHDYFIDPDIFEYGTWYRWDGEYHRGENAIAFTIISGTRPEPKPTLRANNTTDVPGEIVEPLGPYSYITAVGDAPELSVRLDRLDSCNLWVFGNNENLYGVPMVFRNGSYHYQLYPDDTSKLGVGSYNGYIQCNGNNLWKDIEFSNGSLTTPYKGTEDVPITGLGLLPYVVKGKFDTMMSTVPQFDDKLYPIEFHVTVATTTITEVTQDEESLYLAGTTSWSEGTPITLKLDPDNYVLPVDIRKHTWSVNASGSIDGYRTFAIAVPLNKMSLYIGNHQIVSSAEKNGYRSDSYYDFKISDIYVMPTPTPVVKRMVYGKEYEQIPVKITATPTTVPTTTPEWTKKKKAVVNVTANVTETVVQTTITPTSVPAANETIPTVPVEVPVIIAGLAVGYVIWRDL